MKRLFVFIISILLVLPIFAAKKEKVQQVDSLGRKIKTGWNFGVLPSVAFDADLGFQGGALTNIYYYGDGSQYPEYIHSLYAEAAYTTKNYGIFRVLRLSTLARESTRLRSVIEDSLTYWAFPEKWA